MRTFSIPDVGKKSAAELQQQIIDLHHKYQFQILKNDQLMQQNKALKHELEISFTLDQALCAEHRRASNILIQLIQAPIRLCNKLKDTDWQQLFCCMDIIYGSELKHWLTQFPTLSNEEVALCYFCRIGIKHAHVAAFLSVSPQCLTKRKQRLRNKLIVFNPFSQNDISSLLQK